MLHTHQALTNNQCPESDVQINNNKPAKRSEHKACLADMRLDAIYARLEEQYD